MNETNAKLALIEMGLRKFSERFLSEDALPHLGALWEAAKDCNELNLSRGAQDGWVAAMAYAFARMNFLLDDEGPLHIDRREFFEFFPGCSQSTVTQKATRIEKALNFYHGHPDFCLRHVVETTLRMVELPNGMIVPAKFAGDESDDGPRIEIGVLNEEDSLELERQLREKEQAREEEKKEKRRAALRRKRENENKTQLDLFDPGD